MDVVSLIPAWWALVAVVVLAAAWWSLVDRPRWRQRAALACRIGAILALVLALCRPFLDRRSDDLHVVFLLDVSESVDLVDAGAARARIAEAVDHLAAGDSWSLHAVGRSSRPTTLDELATTLEQWRSGLADARFRGGSHLSQALLATRSEFPAGKDRLVVLLSDGENTAGDLGATIRRLRREGIRVAFDPLAGLDVAEAEAVHLRPARGQAFQGEVQRFTARLATNTAMEATARLIHRGVAVAERAVDLDPAAPSDVVFDVPLPVPGPSRWTVELHSARDHFQANNRASCTVDVRGKPRLLFIHEDPIALRPLARALRAQELTVEIRGRRGMPLTLEDVLAFDAIVLADVPATDLTTRQMEHLARYVEDFGGGLAMLGSEHSFGLGGYYKTPVEEVLPLTSRYEKEKERPSLAMVLVMDKSGSMQGAPIALARQAARAAAELLGARDHIGVVAFDGEAQVISTMRTGLERDATLAAIDTLVAGGGTFLYPAMDQAQRMLDRTPAKVKHVIILSDGQSQAADHLGLAQRMGDAGTTVSTVALGQGCDLQLMRAMAQVGRGRFYHTTDPGNVPRIFSRETVEASRSAIKEDLFSAVVTSTHPALAPFTGDDLPLSLGYVMTRAKSSAQVLLATDSGDPLLALGRYGLGHGLAFTSDLSERWGGDWLAWDRCGAFWAQIFRLLARRGDRQGLACTDAVAGPSWTAEIRRVDEAGRPVDSIDWDAKLVPASGPPRPLVVDQIGLGRYRLSVPLADHERFTVRLHDRDHDKLALLAWQRPSPREYALGAAPPAIVGELPRFDPPRIRAALTGATTRRAVRHWAGFLAMGLLILGLALRRL